MPDASERPYRYDGLFAVCVRVKTSRRGIIVIYFGRQILATARMFVDRIALLFRLLGKHCVWLPLSL